MRMYKRIKRRAGELYRSFKQNKTFSFRYAVLCLADEVFWSLRLRKFSNWLHRLKDRWIICYLEKSLLSIVQGFQDDQTGEETMEELPIWVCWWTGEEMAPPLVKKCIKSIYNNRGSHPFRLITKNNYKKYIELPDFMIKKIETNQIILAHVADYIRVALLEKYGGLWLDATIFCSKKISDFYFQFPFFTFKSPTVDSRYISKYRWTTFCLGGKKNNLMFRYLKAALEHYWANNSAAIDYLFFDYIIELGYRKNPKIQVLVDGVPENNLKRDALQMAMNSRRPANDFESIIDDETDFYKLSWRETYELKTVTGEDSIYYHFLLLPL